MSTSTTRLFFPLDQIPIYDVGNPLGVPDYSTGIDRYKKIVSARQRLEWKHRNCTFLAESQHGGLAEYMRLEDCSCQRRYCHDRGTARPNPDFPDESHVRCLCTCDNSGFGGAFCEYNTCKARTDDIANPHPDGFCREKEYFAPGETCTPRCADRFEATRPGPFVCQGDGTWDDDGMAADCVMTFFRCSAPTRVENLLSSRIIKLLRPQTFFL